MGGFFRYARGLYFSRVSSKSNDYNMHSQRDNPKSLGPGSYRCMFLCKVAEGAVYKTQTEQLEEDAVREILTCGYNSVVGESVANGGAINYEETVVYQNEAAIPSYLIVYRLP